MGASGGALVSKRAYNNANRERKRIETRRAIVDAMITAMASGEEDVAVAEVARLSEVSLRTVYQYFPDKAARQSAIQERLDEQLKVSSLLPGSFSDIPAYAERLVDHLIDNEPLIRAQMAQQGLSKTVRNNRKRDHRRHLSRALAERISDTQLVDELCALILCSLRAESVFDMRDLYGLSRARIRARFRSAVTLLLKGYEN